MTGVNDLIYLGLSTYDDIDLLTDKIRVKYKSFIVVFGRDT